MKKRQYNPSYESHSFLGTVTKVMDEQKGILVNKIVIDHPIYYRHFVNTICKVGDKIAMTITNRRPLRSMAQNKYMHVYFSLIADSSGHTTAEVKSWAKGKYLSKGITELYGDKVRIVKDTAKLNISEMCEFLNLVETDTGIPLPDPAPFNLPLTISEYGKLVIIQRNKYRLLYGGTKLSK